MAHQISDLRRKGISALKTCSRRLMGLLAHQDISLRSEAAHALGKIGDQEAVSHLMDALKREKQDEQVPLALGEIGDESTIPSLLDAFNQADRYTRPNIALALGAFRDSKVASTLSNALSDPDPNVRFNCITALGKLRDASSVSPLLASLGEANEWIFMNVVNVLARIADHRATNPIIAFYLKEPNERKRAALVAALGFLRDFTALPTITKALRDPDDRVKANAIEALKRLELPKEKTLNLLQPFLKHSDNRVRGNALIVVSNLNFAEVRPILDSMKDDPDKWIRATLGYVLSIIDFPKALSITLDLLKDEDGDVRKNAAKALASRARDAETDLLVLLLADPSPFVRLQAVLTLGRIKSIPSIPALSKLFSREKNFKIRSAVITSLGEISDSGAVPLLTQALQDADSRVRANSVESLDKILGEQALDTLRPLLNDPDNRTRANAAKAIFQHGDTSVLAHLENMLLENDLPMQISAAFALGKIGLALREIDRSPLQSSLKSTLGALQTPGKEDRKDSLTSPDAASPSKKFPDGKEALREYFLQHFHENRFKEALEGAETFLNRYPNDFSATLFAANINFQLSRFDEAIKYFKIATEIDPFHVQAYGNLAIACFKNGRTQEAIHYFKQALKIQPELSNLRFNLANLLLKENNWEEAIPHYEEGMRHAKAPPRILANLGFAYQKTGQYEKAVRQYESAIIADPRDPGVYYNLALILHRQGKNKEARAILQNALKTVPVGTAGLKTIRDFLDRIKL